MSRLSRLLVPLFVAVALLGVYAFLDNNEDWITLLPKVDPKALLRAVAFVTCIPVIVFAVRLVDLFAFDFIASKRTNVQAPLLLREIVSIAVYLVCIAWAVSAIFEKSVTTFLATGTVLAAILGLALQETLGNLFAGIAIHLEDSFEPGDVIKSGDYYGIVEAVRWRGTRLRTFNNNLVIVPNSVLARERLEVFPRKNFNARIIQFSVDYNVPPAVVIDVLKHAASNVEGVVHDMPCIARVGAFSDSAVVYEIKYFTADYSLRDRIDADVRRAVWYAFRRNAIPVSYPIRAYQKYEAPSQRHQPAPDEILERLLKVDVLSPIGVSAHESIAAAARTHVYSRGETIISRGDEGDSMFIVHQGRVAVRVDDREVAQLEPGDFFGEMALLTGEERTADVVAVTDVVAVEITKAALNPVLQEHPGLAASISAKIVERRSGLDSRQSGSHEEQASVGSRIRAYFGL
jgi:small-conductance mechanosensitive channel